LLRARRCQEVGLDLTKEEAVVAEVRLARFVDILVAQNKTLSALIGELSRLELDAELVSLVELVVQDFADDAEGLLTRRIDQIVTLDG